MVYAFGDAIPEKGWRFCVCDGLCGYGLTGLRGVVMLAEDTEESSKFKLTSREDGQYGPVRENRTDGRSCGAGE